MEDEYTFIVSSLLTGHIISEVELSSFNFTETFNRIGGGNATARLEADTTSEENFLPWGNALWALRGGEITWGGMVGAAQTRASSRVLNIPLHGFMEYYVTQPILAYGPVGLWEYSSPSGAPAPNTTVQWGIPGHPHRSGVTFLDIDQFEIFRELVMHVGRRDALNDIGPDVRWDALSGVTRNRTFWNFEYKDVGTACQQLAEVEDGFVWNTLYEFHGNDPAFYFYLTYPNTGTEHNIVLEYDDDVEASNVTEYDFGGPTKPATGTIFTGEGSGADSLWAQAYALIEEPLGHNTGGRPRYYYIENRSDIKTQSVLQSHANAYFRRNYTPLQTATVTLDPNFDPHYSDFNNGDILWLKVKDQEFDINKQYRVMTKRIVLSKEFDLDVTLDMEEIPVPQEPFT